MITASSQDARIVAIHRRAVKAGLGLRLEPFYFMFAQAGARLRAEFDKHGTAVYYLDCKYSETKWSMN